MQEIRPLATLLQNFLTDPRTIKRLFSRGSIFSRLAALKDSAGSNVRGWRVFSTIIILFGNFSRVWFSRIFKKSRNPRKIDPREKKWFYSNTFLFWQVPRWSGWSVLTRCDFCSLSVGTRCSDDGDYFTLLHICDRFEQKQPCGWVLTNPLNATPLRPGSTFIHGFSRAIYQKIADFNSYLLSLRYQFWKSVCKCGAGMQWRSV